MARTFILTFTRANGTRAIAYLQPRRAETDADPQTYMTLLMAPLLATQRPVSVAEYSDEATAQFVHAARVLRGFVDDTRTRADAGDPKAILPARLGGRV